MSTTSSLNGIAASSGDTQFTNLVINGNPITAHPAANTQITVPGVGYVVLNEQACANPTAGLCAATGGETLSVNAIRVVVNVSTNPLHLPVNAQIVVSNARSGVILP
jgi:hypothetical protein